jgi:hypothetical protein
MVARIFTEAPATADPKSRITSITTLARFGAADKLNLIAPAAVGSRETAGACHEQGR